MSTTTELKVLKNLLVVAGPVQMCKSMNREVYPADWTARRMLLKAQAQEILKRGRGEKRD